MQLKRYRSPSVRDALALARAELGPDALVLSTRLVPASGLRGWLGARLVEVTAATDDLSEDRPAPTADRQASPDGAVHTADGRRWQDGVAARLEAAGLGSALARDVAAATPAWRRRDVSVVTLRRAVADRLDRIAGGADDRAPVEVFVGPPGAGKTTTVAKIAARERAHGGRRLALVAADGFRVGAVEQLRIYAEILGTPFLVARNGQQLEEVLGTLSRPALVDTAGHSAAEGRLGPVLETLAGRPGVRIHLVLPATATPRQAERLLDRFLPAAPARVVLTRVDEAESLGPLVTMISARGLRVSYLGTGQRVPDDLTPATGHALAAHVLGDHTAGELPK
jgi:flagellar biosynthesis protein FlhF